MTPDAVNGLKQAGDVAAAGLTVLTVLKILPAIAAALAVGYYVIVYYEKLTGKQFSETKLAKLLTRRK